MVAQSTAEIRKRLDKEVGRIERRAPFTVALAYPSPYHTGMSSLGYLQMYRLIQEEPGIACERAFLPENEGEAALSYESLRPLSDFPVIAMSVAYELELAGVVRMLEDAGLESLRERRSERDPFVLAGGPLTFSNPLPLAAFADAIVMGEAEEVGLEALRILEGAPSKAAALEALARTPHVFVPEHHGADMPAIAKAGGSALPAWAPIRTRETELSNMFLLEAERGCSRSCTYCVMRRSTNGGMRLATKERILELVPRDATKVGLVGAAVSDHPKIAEILNALADSGRTVGVSSLRPDRLSDELVGALKRAGYKTLTTAMDGPSERLRATLERRARVKHLERAAELARAHGMQRLKLYLMVGLPTETDEDIDECASLVATLSKTIPIALGIAPFCAKRNTPLDGAAFAGIATVNARLARLRSGLKGRGDVRATSARWAWVEYVLAQGGVEEGRAVREAVRASGGFAAYKAAFEAVERRAPKRRSLAIAAV